MSDDVLKIGGWMSVSYETMLDFALSPLSFLRPSWEVSDGWRGWPTQFVPCPRLLRLERWLMRGVEASRLEAERSCDCEWD